MKKTHEILGFTEHEYEMLILQLMLDWAGLYAKGCNRNTQMLLSSRKVTNWFRMELKNLLKEFKKEVEPFLNSSQINYQDRRSLFVRIVTRIHEIYPKALLTEIKIKIHNYDSKRA